jgi:hypothetical protein
MRLACVFFAKFADLMKDDTVAVVGGCFDAITSANFPFVMPFLSIVVRIHVEPSELGPHRFQLRRIVGPDGKPVAGLAEPPVIEFTSAIKPGMRFDVFTTVLQIAGFPFMSSGVYQFLFAVDGAEIGMIELDVLRPPEVRHD